MYGLPLTCVDSLVSFRRFRLGSSSSTGFQPSLPYGWIVRPNPYPNHTFAVGVPWYSLTSMPCMGLMRRSRRKIPQALPPGEILRTGPQKYTPAHDPLCQSPSPVNLNSICTIRSWLQSEPFLRSLVVYLLIRHGTVTALVYLVY